MDCLLETQGVGPEHAIHSAAQVAELGFDGVSLTVPPEALDAGSDAPGALPGLVQTLRDADLTVPLLTCRITRPRDPKTDRLLNLCDEANVRMLHIGCWTYEFPGYWAQVQYAAGQLEELESLAADQHVRLVVPTSGAPDTLHAGPPATLAWVRDCDLGTAGLSIRVDLSDPGGVWPQGIEMVAESLALVELTVQPGSTVAPGTAEALVSALTEIDYRGPLCFAPAAGVTGGEWLTDAQTQVAKMRDLLQMQQQPDEEDGSSPADEDDEPDEVSPPLEEPETPAEDDDVPEPEEPAEG